MREGSAQALIDATSDHRRRLIAAMGQAASEHGYREASVSRVIELAGVSRATFYEHFSDRDECFLETYQALLKDVRVAVRAAVEASTPRERPAAVLDILVSELAARPANARLILIEALAAPLETRTCHEDLIARIDEEVADFLDAQPPSEAIQIPSTALLGGVGEVLSTRVLGDAEYSLGRLREELARWIDTYRLPSGEAPVPQRRWREEGRFSPLVRPAPPTPTALLPRGRSALPPDDAAGVRRKRLLDATLSLIADGGYASLTVARIAAAARVPRSAFYSHFSTKEDALLAAQKGGMQGALAAAAAEYGPSAPWPERVWRSLIGFLTYVAENPGLARLDFVESYAAGRAATRHRQENRTVFALFLEEGYRQNTRAERLSHFCSEAIGAAVFGLMWKLVSEGRTEQMLSLTPSVAYTVLAPFLGPREAWDRVEEWRRVGC